jgi:hypothetical protein
MFAEPQQLSNHALAAALTDPNGRDWVPRLTLSQVKALFSLVARLCEEGRGGAAVGIWLLHSVSGNLLPRVRLQLAATADGETVCFAELCEAVALSSLEGLFLAEARINGGSGYVRLCPTLLQVGSISLQTPHYTQSRAPDTWRCRPAWRASLRSPPRHRPRP